MLELYGIQGKQQDALVQIAEEARLKGWWHTFPERAVSALIGFEAAAVSIRSFEALLIPGLFQTEEYARAVLRALQPELHSDELESQVQLRMARQIHLIQDDPPAIWAILDEAAVRRQVGSVKIMIDQLKRLIEVSEQPAITLQILPFSTGQHAGMDGSFTIHSFPEPGDPDVIYLGNAMSDYYLEGDKAVRRYGLLFNHLRTVALKPEGSAAFLKKLIKRGEEAANQQVSSGEDVNGWNLSQQEL
jgi:hypothetical protein